MQSADARLFSPSSSAPARTEPDHTGGPSDAFEKSIRGDTASPRCPRHGLRSEMLAAGSIHIMLNDMVRRAAVLDGHDQETTQFILDAIQRFWPFRYEDELDAIRSVACTASSHGRQTCNTPASASTEASFQTAASCLPVVGGLAHLGPAEPDNGETVSKET